MTRIRELGVTPGFYPTGPLNAITDVPGVKVGHSTIIKGEGTLNEGVGPIRTGVTAVLPHDGNLFEQKVTAAVDAFNGFGKANGFEQVREVGTIETPILLTNTLNVGKVADAVVAYMLHDNPGIGKGDGTVNPVVGECNDGYLSDIRGRHASAEHVHAAIESARSGPVAEGNVGAGTGTQCYQFKGGIGTASRVIYDQYTIGALVQTNFGSRRELTVYGAPVGKHFIEEYMPTPGPGSIMLVMATDAPLDPRQLRRSASRAVYALARTGSVGHHGSGDFIIAFSTAHRWPHHPDKLQNVIPRVLTSENIANTFFTAVVEAFEEAILNALTAAETMTGRDGNTLHAIPTSKLAELLEYYRVIDG